jgi:hypothetical protein
VGGKSLPVFFRGEIMIPVKSCRENQESAVKACELLMDAMVWGREGRMKGSEGRMEGKGVKREGKGRSSVGCFG